MVTTEQQELLQSIVDWQNENMPKGWNEDNLRDQIGITINEDFEVLSEDQDVDVKFTGRSRTKKTFDIYTITRDSEGIYTIEASTPSEDQDAEDAEEEE